jgi:hypothetical protein
VLNFHLFVEDYQATLRSENKLQRKKHNLRRIQLFGRGKHIENKEEIEAISSTMDKPIGRRFNVERKRG